MSGPSLPQHRSHPRTWRENRFVYPVVSRRSHGLSLGINLNPDKICNFDCIYCQVDRREESETRFVELDRLLEELDVMLELIQSERIYDDPAFASVPAPLRRLNDLAFSGDGEPTTYRNFDEIVQRVADVKAAHGLTGTRMILITNASMFHRPAVQRGLRVLDENQGEIWAKLDAGTEDYYRLVERTTIPFSRILDNLLEAARARPLVIQALFMQIHGSGPSDREIDEWIRRLEEILERRGHIDRVQVYTVARPPAESFVAPLPQSEIDRIADRLEQRTGLSTERFGG